MDECEVCLSPTVDIVTVAFDCDGTRCTVRFCRDCIALVLELMTERWRRAIGDHNEAVAAMMEMLGIEDAGAGSEAGP